MAQRFTNRYNPKSLTGLSGYVTIPTAVAFDDIWNGGGTFEFWMKIAMPKTSSGDPLFEDDTSSWVISVDNPRTSASLKFGRVYDGASNGEWSISNPAIFGEWCHVVIGYTDGAANNPDIFINGVSQAVTETATPLGNPVAYAGNDQRYCQISPANTSFSTIRIFDGNLHSSEILWLYYNGVLPNNTLVEEWDFSEGTGATLGGTNGNNGVITTLTWSTEAPNALRTLV